MSDYLIDGDRDRAERRLAIQEDLQDPTTFEILDRLGVAEGWRCLEVGAGRGSVADWLCRRVGPRGRVVATDLDDTMLVRLDHACLEIRRRDVATDEIDDEAYDLVHARDVLVHVPESDSVLRKFLRALRPGGFVLIEEPDVSTEAADPSVGSARRRLFDHVTASVYAFLRARGLDPVYGRGLLGALRRAGFRDLGAEGRVRWFRGSAGGTESPHMMAFADLADGVVSAGFARRRDFDAFLSLSRDPTFAWREAMTVSAWGRRPEGPPS